MTLKKLVMEFMFLDVQPWWAHRARVIAGCALMQSQSISFILNLLMLRGKMGKIVAIYENTSSHPSVLLCRCFNLVLEIISILMSKGNLVPEKRQISAAKQGRSSTSEISVWYVGLLLAKYEVRLSHYLENI